LEAAMAETQSFAHYGHCPEADFSADLRLTDPPQTQAPAMLLAWVRYMLLSFTERFGNWDEFRGNRCLPSVNAYLRGLLRLWLEPMERVVREVVERLARPLAQAWLKDVPSHVMVELAQHSSHRSGSTQAPYGDCVLARVARILSIAQDPSAAIRARASAMVVKLLRTRTKIERNPPRVRALFDFDVVLVPQTPPREAVVVQRFSEAKRCKRE
jgi:hypothetical protein